MVRLTDQDGYPTTCCICAGAIVKTRDDDTHTRGLRFHLDDVTGRVLAWHVTCERQHGWPLTWSRSA